jgi:diguanylate cyclase (GGDEF)-like protein
MVESTIIQVGGIEVRATVSLGVAPRPAPGESVATWFSEADIALYEAKQFGRNRVAVGKARRPVDTAGQPTAAMAAHLH